MSGTSESTEAGASNYHAPCRQCYSLAISYSCTSITIEKIELIVEWTLTVSKIASELPFLTENK